MTQLSVFSEGKRILSGISTRWPGAISGHSGKIHTKLYGAPPFGGFSVTEPLTLNGGPGNAAPEKLGGPIPRPRPEPGASKNALEKPGMREASGQPIH